MATEPTLGRRILDAADRHAEAYGWWLAETEEDEAPGPLHAKQRATRETVRALAARADAAERLAKAAVALPIARAKWAAADDASDIIDAFEAFTVVRKEHEQAADMWRVITEGNEVPS